ncbi:MAG: methyltransferase domain-containing protein [Pirellulaceae bacterium]|nr:methyltransferase domain-containing protein [Pirellulaceae bacterium]
MTSLDKQVLKADPSKQLDVEQAVRDRYSAASQQAESALCCPVDYQPQFLDVLPAELIERDYGCGDPSRYVYPGETVLDLGSGGGKICYIAAQVVGESGKVIGVDMNDDMLALARKYQQPIGNKLGFHNVQFHKARIQDLALDVEKFEQYLQAHPVSSSDQWWATQAEADGWRREQPMIANDSIDVIVSNCVLNLVTTADRQQLFSEMMRVLRRGGRAIISDIVSDEPVPDRLKRDATLWSGCISGAFVEDELLAAFSQAGFYGMEMVARQEEPWTVLEGIEFRSVTIRAFKGKEGPCLDHHQAVIYRGPWKSVQDDDGHTLRRGERTAVCGKTFDIYTRAPYTDHVIPVPPYSEVSVEEAKPLDCRRNEVRPPQKTKGLDYQLTTLPNPNSCCDTDCC